jgi:dTDP-D-glucose 4,6-dehydratase
MRRSISGPAFFAAESHVDRSSYAAGAFLATNVMGTQTLLDAPQRHGVDRFVPVSTDEVYGPLLTGSAAEDAPLRPGWLTCGAPASAGPATHRVVRGEMPQGRGSLRD